ncbi:MAG TPA: TPM domain-containing protein [Xanthomonadaceae bacterium]|nr:TPM domain-containing protein [Xanthomonadaceae bacterium]
MRLLRHLFAPSAQRLFPAATMDRIAAAIAEGERRHAGQVLFAVEPALHWRAVLAGVDARRSAEHAFARLRAWDTEANNGVLLYLLLADHRIEIVADRGLRGVVDESHWRAICERMEVGLRGGDAEAAVIGAVGALSDLLTHHFPAPAGGKAGNELPDRPQIL